MIPLVAVGGTERDLVVCNLSNVRQRVFCDLLPRLFDGDYSDRLTTAYDVQRNLFYQRALSHSRLPGNDGTSANRESADQIIQFTQPAFYPLDRRRGFVSTRRYFRQYFAQAIDLSAPASHRRLRAFR